MAHIASAPAKNKKTEELFEIEEGKEVAREVRDTMSSAIKEHLERGFLARLGEADVSVDDGFVVLN